MRLSRTDLVPVLAIIAGGAVGLAVSASLVLSTRFEYAAAPVPLDETPVTAELATDGRGYVFRSVDETPQPVFSPDGRSIMYWSRDGQPIPALSPDGRWLAYSSDESGREEVYVRSFPNVESGRIRMSINGGSRPQWASNGQELFFWDADRGFVVAEVAAGENALWVRADGSGGGSVRVIVSGAESTRSEPAGN